MQTHYFATTILPGFEVSTDPDRLDIDLIHRFLDASYWAAGRSREVVERSIRHSLCFGVYAGEQQVAFARAITDCAVFAYLADVFVVPEFRGQGISKALVRAILAHPDLQGLKVFLLRTRDAQGLYAQFGFEAIANPEEMMVLRRD
jgi:GNAT superfamily N-acetyltransferase